MVNLYVEGGGSTRNQKASLRQGLQDFLTKFGLKVSMLKVVACGPRHYAYRRYRNGLKKGESAVLLVDSEGKVDARHQRGKPEKWQPWQHLREREGDGWTKPRGASDMDCHLMVECMENWFLADRQVLQGYFASGFSEARLPSADRPLEDIPKRDVLDGLNAATRNCATKGPYNKGKHSFDLLSKIDPHQVVSQSPWAKRFVDLLTKKMNP